MVRARGSIGGGAQCWRARLRITSLRVTGVGFVCLELVVIGVGWGMDGEGRAGMNASGIDATVSLG
jgi:hypothetical protein